MIKLYETGAYYAGGKLIPDDENAAGALAARGLTADREAGAKKTIAWSILEAHNQNRNRCNKLCRQQPELFQTIPHSMRALNSGTQNNLFSVLFYPSLFFTIFTPLRYRIIINRKLKNQHLSFAR